MEDKKVQKRNLWFFPLGTVGRDMVYNLINSYLLTFVMLTRHLDPAQLGAITAIMIAARIFDALNDPLMGNIIERTRTKWGKFKPWLVIGILTTSIVIYLTFNIPLQGWPFVVFFGIMYFAYSITYTMHDISYWGMVPALSSDPDMRNAYTSRANLFAGIGDTYAKYYEVSVSARGESLSHYKALGVHMSRMCMETLLAHGEQALKDNAAGKATYELEQAALAIIITTGWVSMLVARDHTMDYNGGVAHALFYSLCELPGFDETHIHGVVVGFGCLLLLLIDGQREEYEKLRAFNQKIGLPTSLKDMGITIADVEKVADRITRDEDLEHYPYHVTKEMILQAARELE